MLPVLKGKLLAKDSVVHCDETWSRVKIAGKYRKKYIWGMVNEEVRSSSASLLPKGRKNSLGFGSHAGVEVSVIYHTFIETCKMCGVSTLEYFKEFFKAASKREQTKVLLSVCRA